MCRPSVEPLPALPTDPDEGFGGDSEEEDDSWELEFLLRSGVGVDQMVAGVLGTSAETAQDSLAIGNVGDTEQSAVAVPEAAAKEDLELALWLVGRSFELDR